jgi:short-subunit dehydrogenase
MGRKAIIIGATSGIGKELAKLLVANNYKVGITGRRTELLSELKNTNPDLFFVKTFDVTDTKTSIEKLEELVIELNGLDLLIISSGIGDINKNLDFSIEKDTIDTNVLGFTAVSDWTFNYFEKTKAGHLVAITSIAGLRGNRHGTSYSATKSYQMNYLEGLRQKVCTSKHPIIITDIRPGFVDTGMAKGDELFWVSDVDKAVRQIYKAIKQKRKIVYVTRRWIIIALILKLLPSWFSDKI